MNKKIPENMKAADEQRDPVLLNMDPGRRALYE
jgi:hypothetical protein